MDVIKNLKPMQKYWSAYFILLTAYVAFNVLWIEGNAGMDKSLKIVLTGSIMVFLSMLSIWALRVLSGKWFHAIRIWLISIILWAIVVDVSLGLILHDELFYMSVNTWPDSYLYRIFRNGTNYFMIKCMFLVLCGVFNGVMNKRSL